MERRFWYGLGILAVLLGLGLWTGLGMENRQKPVTDALEQAAQAALEAKEWAHLVDIKAIILAAVLWVLTNKVKQTKKLHAIVFIAASAVVGIIFGFANL